MISFEELLKVINQMLEAGIAITALSLFIRSLSFNLRERVSRSFAVILACVVILFSGEAISGAVRSDAAVEFWQHFQWLGILFLPPTLQNFADALLTITGRPSMGRRRALIYFSFFISFLFVLSLILGLLLGPVDFSNSVYAHPTSTPLSVIFSFYYVGSVVIAGSLIWRAYLRTRLKSSRRRISYLLVGAIFLAVGAYPYMQIGSAFAQRFSEFFIALVIFGNIGIFLCLMLMAYAVAFFGVSWPDRVVRSRLLKWVLRGPVTVFMMLFLITIVYQVSNILGVAFEVAIPIVSVISVMLMEHLITLVFPYVERWLLRLGDDGHYYLLQSLADRLITSGDLRQFLEAVLAAICDYFQVSTGFVAALNENRWEIIAQAGKIDELQEEQLGQTILEQVTANGNGEIFWWGDFWLYPLYTAERNELIGIIGILRKEEHQLNESLIETMKLLGERTTMALEDRRLQRQIFASLEELQPKVDVIQRLRAALRFDQSRILNDITEFDFSPSFPLWVKDALSHYWGGPKLTESPLLGLQVVKESLEEHEGNPANALRAILRNAVDQVKPSGDQKLSPEWILYNILELKFLEGRKVREIARRLALSEADLYRKQRVAIEAVAQTILEMEIKAREQ